MIGLSGSWLAAVVRPLRGHAGDAHRPLLGRSLLWICSFREKTSEVF